jgi:hypothetical protein
MTNPDREKLEAIRAMCWRPKFVQEVKNRTTSGDAVDLWFMVEDETGEPIVSLGVPRGRSDIAGYVAACCGNPTRRVTSMDLRDLRLDGIHDPEDKLSREADAVATKLYMAVTEHYAEGGQVNGWAVNDALSYAWYVFCGQLSHEQRGRLLFRFMQFVTVDRTPEDSAAALDARQKPTSSAGPTVDEIKRTATAAGAPKTTDTREVQEILFAAMRAAAAHVEPTSVGASILAVVMGEAMAAIVTELMAKGNAFSQKDLKNPEPKIKEIVRDTVGDVEHMLRNNLLNLVATLRREGRQQ